jgi:Right handed beta helix region
MYKKLILSITTISLAFVVVAFAQESSSTPATSTDTAVSVSNGDPQTSSAPDTSSPEPDAPLSSDVPVPASDVSVPTEPPTVPTPTLPTLDASSSASSTTIAAPQPSPPPAPIAIACGQTVKNASDYPSIQAAINAANEGETVHIAAGTYNEGIVMRRGVCLEGAGVDQTTITNPNGYGINIYDLVSAKVRDLTVKGSARRGLNIHNSSDISIASCRLTENTDDDGGGLLIFGSSDVSVDHCLFDHNRSSLSGGGVSVSGSNHGGITFSSVTVAYNSAEGEGGLWAAAPVTIRDSIFWGNTGTNSNIDLRDYCYQCNNITISNSTVGEYHDGRNYGMPQGAGLSSEDPLITGPFLGSGTRSDIGAFPWR